MAGSTRMQASSILMFSVGLCLFSRDLNEVKLRLKNFLELHMNTDFRQLKDFIEFRKYKRFWEEIDKTTPLTKGKASPGHKTKV